jgi:hypothetical protein
VKKNYEDQFLTTQYRIMKFKKENQLKKQKKTIKKTMIKFDIKIK